MILPRESGILLHPTSLPGPDGIGDLGPEAYQWIDFLNASGTKIWQVLPLGPTGYGDSPYQCFSAFAGNPYLVSPTLLLDQGLLTRDDLSDRPVFPIDKIDYGAAINWKILILERAFRNFQNNPTTQLTHSFSQFKAQNAFWLPDLFTFHGNKKSQGGGSWLNWALPLKMRDQTALTQFENENSEGIQRHAFRQFLFFDQWHRLKNMHIKTISISWGMFRFSFPWIALMPGHIGNYFISILQVIPPL